MGGVVPWGKKNSCKCPQNNANPMLLYWLLHTDLAWEILSGTDSLWRSCELGNDCQTLD